MKPIILAVDQYLKDKSVDFSKDQIVMMKKQTNTINIDSIRKFKPSKKRLSLDQRFASRTKQAFSKAASSIKRMGGQRSSIDICLFGE